MIQPLAPNWTQIFLGFTSMRVTTRAAVPAHAGEMPWGRLWRPSKHALKVVIETACIVCSVRLGFPQPCGAQIERYELGKRVVRFERAWQTATSDHRAASVPAMNSAVRSFFSLDPKQAAEHVDHALMDVTAVESPSGLLKYCLSRRVAIRDLLADTTRRQLQIKISQFYDPGVAGFDLATLRLKVRRSSGQIVGQKEIELSRAVSGFTWPLETDEGDFRLECTVEDQGITIPLEPVMFSRVDRLDRRLEALELPSPDALGHTDETCRATNRDAVKRLTSLHNALVPECDLPACRILRFNERLLEADTAPAGVVASLAAEGDVWMTLSRDGKQVAVRLRAPSNLQRGKLPVLFLFHGAGGSENMFFETYGAGRAVQLAMERGWLVVAPRQSFSGLPLNCLEQVEILEQYFLIDPQQVYLLGHSMGAAQVVRQVATAGSHAQIRAAAALGGGGQPAESVAIARIPWFIAAGKQDFGRPMALALADRLKSLEADVRYREYENVEHLVIVQAALDDVFRFFDHARPN